jgi:hypothetical protein
MKYGGRWWEGYLGKGILHFSFRERNRGVQLMTDGRWQETVAANLNSCGWVGGNMKTNELILNESLEN